MKKRKKEREREREKEREKQPGAFFSPREDTLY
jgi:hypothetical protein